MSSKKSLPESMELLLDTMCNTFGGVMFIAISLALLVFMLHKEYSPEKQNEMDQKTIDLLKEEKQRLNNRYELVKKDIEMLKKEISIKNPVAPELRRAVIDLEQQLRDVEAELENLKNKMTSARRRTDKLKQQNDRMQSELNDKKKSISRKLKTLEQRRKHLDTEITLWRKKLTSTPRRYIHFASNKLTNANPYTVLVKNGNVYRLGTNVRRSSSEVRVRLEGNIVHMTPVHGVSIDSLTTESVRNMFDSFSRNHHFLWIEVSPESLASFVVLRRMLRANDMPVYWYLEPEFHVVLVRDANYSAAQ